MIFTSERVLVSGKAFRFKTVPYDPNDAFRGKYVALDFYAKNLDETVEYHGDFTSKKMVYALLIEDSSGFAKVVRIQEQRPDFGYYVKVKLSYYYLKVARIEFPFNKFFLPEDKAEEAEDFYFQQNFSERKDSYAIVRIDLQGSAVIEDLVIGGVPIEESLRLEEGF